MKSTFLNCRSNGWSLRHMKGEFSSNPLWRISPFVPSTDTHSVSLILSRFLGAEKCLAQVSGARHTEKERGIEYNIFLTFQRAWEWVVPLFSFELVPKDLGSRTPKRISLKKLIFYIHVVLYQIARVYLLLGYFLHLINCHLIDKVFRTDDATASMGVEVTCPICWIRRSVLDVHRVCPVFPVGETFEVALLHKRLLFKFIQT